MQGLKGDLYNYAKPTLGVYPYFHHFKHAGKIIKLKQVKPELSHTRVAKQLNSKQIPKTLGKFVEV
jgi:hypothetical protein